MSMGGSRTLLGRFLNHPGGTPRLARPVALSFYLFLFFFKPATWEFISDCHLDLVSACLTGFTFGREHRLVSMTNYDGKARRHFYPTMAHENWQAHRAAWGLMKPIRSLMRSISNILPTVRHNAVSPWCWQPCACWDGLCGEHVFVYREHMHMHWLGQ